MSAIFYSELCEFYNWEKISALSPLQLGRRVGRQRDQGRNTERLHRQEMETDVPCDRSSLNYQVIIMVRDSTDNTGICLAL